MAFGTPLIREPATSQARLPTHLQDCYVQLVADLGERLSYVTRAFSRICVLGDSHSLVGKTLRVQYPHASIHDLSFLPPAEAGSYDLVVDWERLHRAGDIQESLIQARSLLAPGGLYMAGCWGNETLHSFQKTLIHTDLEVLGKAHQRLFPFMKPRSAAQLLQFAPFDLPVCDWDRIQVKYTHVGDLLRDVMIHEGVPLLGVPLTSRYLRALQRNFVRDHAHTAVSFDWLWLLGWMPSSRQ